MDEEEATLDLSTRNQGNINRVGQEQMHDLIFSDKLSWQAIIYDLIQTGQLDPWDIDISLLSHKYLEKVRQLEEANFFISSKVLLAASLLLRLKSEILLHEFLPNLDDLLYGRKDEKHVYKQERITLDEEIPGLVPRTPLPRYRKVTLEELMQALGKAINTETRRIRKVVIAKQQEFETAIALPKHRINLKDRIQEVYSKLQDIFKEREEKLAFTDFIANNTKEDKITTFVPLLHLDYQQKVWLEQHKHFDEIWILLKHLYEKQNKELLAQMKKEVEEEMKKYAQEMSEEDKEKAEKINEEFSNPIGESV